MKDLNFLEPKLVSPSLKFIFQEENRVNKGMGISRYRNTQRKEKSMKD